MRLHLLYELHFDHSRAIVKCSFIWHMTYQKEERRYDLFLLSCNKGTNNAHNKRVSVNN